MEKESTSIPTAGATQAALPIQKSAEDSMRQLSGLVHELGGEAETAKTTSEEAQVDNRLAVVRTGIASSLFFALRGRNRQTAEHSLRTALLVSSWCNFRKIEDELRDALEVAALFHDLGKICVADHILLKPSALSPSEVRIMQRVRRSSLEILSCSCARADVLEALGHMDSWFDGSRPGMGKSKDQIPVGARMLAIADAYDSMTSDQVYRRAMACERALHELFRCSGTQFDPKLVEDFAEFVLRARSEMIVNVKARWLDSLKTEQNWQLNALQSSQISASTDAMFHLKMMENMHDGVMFVDTGLKVVKWNRSAERLTGIMQGAIIGQRWVPSVLALADDYGAPIADTRCPVDFCIRSSVQWLKRLKLRNCNGQVVSINAHCAPVMNAQGETLGATLLMHDISPEITLEERCINLHEKATKDALTGVANRAELNRVHEEFIRAHQERGLPYSLIVTDIDRFKSVNDTYGHQAGDEVLKMFAALLQSFCRTGDLVARYGGEEFVILCADCDISTVRERADQIRQTLSKIPQRALEGKFITASFGVTQFQNGDSGACMIRRADRALYQAKSQGRNMVVQLGIGTVEPTPAPVEERRQVPESTGIHETLLMTNVPLNVAVEKFRGFAADHHAHISRVSGTTVCLRMGSESAPMQRRQSDRQVWFNVIADFHESSDKLPAKQQGQDGPAGCAVHVKIVPCKKRDRHTTYAQESMQRIHSSMQSYLMATSVEIKCSLREEMNTTTTNHWLGRLFKGNK